MSTLLKNLTLIMAHKNRTDNLRYNIKSLENCEYVPNVIIVDFNSSESLDFCNKPFISIIKVTENTKLFHKSRALNIGIKRAKTPFVCMSDVDQVFEKNFFKVVYNRVRKNDQAFIMCKTYRLYTVPEEITPNNIMNHYYDLKKDAKRIDPKRHGAGCCQAAQRKWFMEIRGYDEGFIGWGCQDSDLVRRAKLSGLRIVDADDRTSMLHLPHDRIGHYYRLKKERNRKYYDKVIRNKVIIANRDGNWGKLSLSEKNDKVIVADFKKNHFRKVKI